MGLHLSHPTRSVNLDSSARLLQNPKNTNTKVNHLHDEVMEIDENGVACGKTYCTHDVLTSGQSRERSSLCDFFDENNASDLNNDGLDLTTGSFDLRDFKVFFLHLSRVSLLISFSDKVNG